MTLKVLLFLSLLLPLTLYTRKVIVPHWPSGRFGDHLILYADAKWLAYKTGMPLVVAPCFYSQALVLDKYETEYREDNFHDYHRVNVTDKQRFIREGGKRTRQQHDKTLYRIYYEPVNRNSERFAEYQSDIQFITTLRKMVRPSRDLSLIKPHRLPNTMNVAVHIRKGTPGMREEIARDQRVFKHLSNGSVALPFSNGRFLPDSYYIKQMRWFATQFSDKQIQFFLFTDFEFPDALCDMYLAELSDLKNIVVLARKDSCQEQDAVLADFFSLLEFDNLIRSDSSFAVAAELLGDYDVVLSPRIVLRHFNNPAQLLPEPCVTYRAPKDMPAG